MIVKVTEVIKKNESHKLIKWVSTNQGAPAHVTVSTGEMEIHVAHGDIHAGDLLEIKKHQPIAPKAATEVKK